MREDCCSLLFILEIAGNGAGGSPSIGVPRPSVCNVSMLLARDIFVFKPSVIIPLPLRTERLDVARPRSLFSRRAEVPRIEPADPVRRRFSTLPELFCLDSIVCRVSDKMARSAACLWACVFSSNSFESGDLGFVGELGDRS